MVFELLSKLHRKPDVRRKISPLTRKFLDLIVRAPVMLRSQKLLSTIVKALKEVKEALSTAARILRYGVAEAWRASMIAYSWGNKKALEWRRDKAFITYWGAMILNWPKRLLPPTTQIG